MYSFTALAFATQFLVLNTNAQNNTELPPITCEVVEDAVQYNSSSTTRTIPALRLKGSRIYEPTGGPGDFPVEKDDDRTWDLSVRVQSIKNSMLYTQTVFLDTGDSNMTDIGSCYQTVQPEDRMLSSQTPENRTLSFQWTREVMERSLEDNGDCTSLLGVECIQALKREAAAQASEWPLRSGSCTGMNNSVPPECSSILGTGPMKNGQMNLTLLNGMIPKNGLNFDIIRGHYNSEIDPSLECNDLNISSTHSAGIAAPMSYEAAVRFPTINVISFWPNRTSGLSTSYSTGWREDVHVEVACMRPDSSITGWSETPPTGSELLSREDAKFPPSSRASTLNSGVLVRMSAAIVGVMIVM